MPRLPHQLILKAYSISPLLPLVLRGTRTLNLAINELRWLKEHVSSTHTNLATRRKKLKQLCIRRSRAEPLQYLLGSQPFGELDIKCRKGVLIPRPETEAYTTHLASLLLTGKLNDILTVSDTPTLKILDVCSGSGCISLLLHSLLSKKLKNLDITGLDISPTALDLARQSLEWNVKKLHLIPEAKFQVRFEECDVLNHVTICEGTVDIIISNPPYISRRHFLTETSRSVRNYEPVLALVPQLSDESHRAIAPEDVFYARLLEMHIFHNSKILLMEVGDEEQARRVVKLALAIGLGVGNKIEVWRDWPDGEAELGEERVMKIEGKEVMIKGTGKTRSVVLFKHELENMSPEEP